jgi:hypothetical protein
LSSVGFYVYFSFFLLLSIIFFQLFIVSGPEEKLIQYFQNAKSIPEANFILAIFYFFGAIKNEKLAYDYFKNAHQHQKELYCISTCNPNNIAGCSNLEREVEMAFSLFELLFIQEEITKTQPLIDTSTSQTNNNNKSNNVVIQHGKLNLDLVDEKPKDELKTSQLCTIF